MCSNPPASSPSKHHFANKLLLSGARLQVDQSEFAELREHITQFIEFYEGKINEYHRDLVQSISVAAFERLPGANDFLSVYTGIAGISYMYLFLYFRAATFQEQGAPNSSSSTTAATAASSMPTISRNKLTKDYFLRQFIFFTTKVEEYLNTKKRWAEDEYGFSLGISGALVLVIINKMLQQQSFDVPFQNLKKLCQFSKAHNQNVQTNELLYGRAGLLYAFLFLKQIVIQRFPDLKQKTQVLKDLNEMIQTTSDIVISHSEYLAKQYPNFSCLVSKWDDDLYIGAGHGITGILYVLLDLLKDENKILVKAPSMLLKQIEASALWITKHAYNQSNSNNFSVAMNALKDDKLVQWCHGSAGIIPFLLKVHEHTKAPKLLVTAEDASDSLWRDGLLTKGFGICHGIAGNMHSFLKLYLATGNKEYLAKLIHFVKFILTTEHQMDLVKTPENPMSLYEGLGGTVCMLTTVLELLNNPNGSTKTAHFPGYDLL